MKPNRDSLAFKLAIAPFLFAYLNAPVFIHLHIRPCPPALLAPLAGLNLLIFLDIFTRRHSAQKDEYSIVALTASLLLFPLAVWLPYLEFSILGCGKTVPWLFAPGLALEAFGACLIVRSRAALGKFGAVDITIEPDHRLIVTGPYKYVRNPIYAGFLVLILGYSMACCGLATGLVSDLAVFAFLIKRIRLEEPLLRNAFPGQYDSYARETGMLFPRLIKKYSGL